jgi:predicted nuclease of restriction endonuclease-like (RecB) superfamily
MKGKRNVINTKLFADIRSLIVEARSTVARSVDFVQVWTNFHIGKMIVEHEQKGALRAEYSERLLANLSEKLSKEFGRGFAKRNLEYMRRFYFMFRDRIAQSLIAQSSGASGKLSRKSSVAKSDSFSNQAISQSLISKSGSTQSQSIAQSPIEQLCPCGVFTLSWTHYLYLMSIEDPDERSFYEVESAAQNWSVRELRRQFDTSLYERLVLSRNKSKVRELAKKGQIIIKPEDAIKEPVVLEFLGLDEKTHYTETNLETVIINKIERFLLEMGKGFLFEARQKRLTINDKHFHVDLVLYNRLLRCYVLVDLKIGELTHQDIGQMQMYVHYTDRKIKTVDENPTVGIILCRKKDDALVEITLPESNKQIFASRYKLYLPSKAQLRRQISEVHVAMEENK